MRGMPRALWTGTISFGLVNIPVKLYRATASGSAKSISFHLLHEKCGSRIKNVRWCPHCDEAVEWKDLIKGYEVSKGRYVKVDPEELDKVLPDEDFAAVAIDSFSLLEEVDPIYFDRGYYAAPEGSPKAYVLLTRALAESGRVAIARVTLRTRSHLAILRPKDGYLLLSTMFFENEVVSADEVAGLPEVKKQAQVDNKQLDAALQLIDQMTVGWDPSKYSDEYAEKVEHLIEEKIAGGEVSVPEEVAAAEEGGGKVVDLLEALRRSVKQPEAEKEARRPKRARGGATKRRTHSHGKKRAS
jgi:DNA end-binding protein Ku